MAEKLDDVIQLVDPIQDELERDLISLFNQLNSIKSNRDNAYNLYQANQTNYNKAVDDENQLRVDIELKTVELIEHVKSKQIPEELD